MNTFRFHSGARVRVPALAALLALSSLISSNATAATRCEAPTSRVDRVACEKAKEGPDALRRFVQRTQSIYGLYFWDYMTAVDLERHYARQQVRPPEQAAGDEQPRVQAGMQR